LGKPAFDKSFGAGIGLMSAAGSWQKIIGKKSLAKILEKTRAPSQPLLIKINAVYLLVHFEPYHARRVPVAAHHRRLLFRFGSGLAP